MKAKLKVKYKAKFNKKLTKSKQQKYLDLAASMGDYLNIKSMYITIDGVEITPVITEV